jgi:hypothetical protein
VEVLLLPRRMIKIYLWPRFRRLAGDALGDEFVSFDESNEAAFGKPPKNGKNTS